MFSGPCTLTTSTRPAATISIAANAILGAVIVRMGGRRVIRSHCCSVVKKFWYGWQWRCGWDLPRPTKDSAPAATLSPHPPDMWRCDVCKTAMFHEFYEVCRQEEMCSKDTPIVLYGKRDDVRSRGRVCTDAKPADRADMGPLIRETMMTSSR